MNHRSVMLCVAVAALVGACSPAGEAEPADGHPEFSYAGAEGPDAWGSLSEEYRTCDEGRAQSPIDLVDAAEQPVPELVVDYATSDVEIEHTGHTVQVTPTEGSGIELDGVRYDLVQLHVHVPSEHGFAGRLSDGELHYVHDDGDGNLAVLGVALSVGEPHVALEQIVTDLPDQGEPPRTLSGFPIDALLPQEVSTYQYSGSLTTPPCTEDVRWTIFTESIAVSAEQLDAFVGVLPEGHNNRPLQARNDREILTTDEP